MLRTSIITLAVAAAAATLAPAPSCTAFASPGTDALAASAKQSGFATWRDRTATVVTESHGEQGVTREREAAVSEMNDPDGGHRTLMEYDSPADVQGTMYLHVRPRSGEEQEWIWTPAARKSRRIAPGGPDEQTSGAELSYRDLETMVRVLQWGEADADATLLADETADGRTLQVIEITSKTNEFPYSKYRLKIGKDDLVPRGLEIIDAEGKPEAIVRIQEIETIDGHATPKRVEIVAPQTDRKSVLRLSDVRYDRDLPDTTFTLARLNRGR